MDVDGDQADLALLLQQSDTFPRYTNYQPLDKATRSMRLLQIRHGFDGEIHATIVHASLDDDQIEYEALSYCWGPPDIPKTIYIGHKALLIRSSLHEFLDALCRSGQSMPIWVDSICINQRDVHERNWQVSMMGDVYRRATRVKSWIGPSDANSEYAFAYIKYYSNEAFLSSSNFSRLKVRAHESFQIVLDRPYWKRLWIVQEMALARELLIICGSKVTSWEAFLNIYKQDFASGHIVHALSDFKTQGPGEAFALVGDGAPDVPDYLDPTRTTTLVPRSSLLAQMERFGGQACEDPRDRIFGLLSISENADQIAVDYTKPLADVLLGVILATYQIYLTSRPHIAAGYQHAVFTQKPDVFAKTVGFIIFSKDVARCLQPTGLLLKPCDLLCSLSSVENCLGIHLGVPMLISSHTRLGRDIQTDGSVVFSREGEEILAKAVCMQFCGGIFDFTFVHWRSHEVMPRIIGCRTTGIGDPRLSWAHEILFQMGEIQLCSQARPALGSPGTVYESLTYEFSLHFSPFAVLAIICVESMDSETPTWSVDIGAIETCLQHRRRRYPRPELCACEVSAELNLEAFRLYEEERELLGGTPVS